MREVSLTQTKKSLPVVVRSGDDHATIFLGNFLNWGGGGGGGAKIKKMKCMGGGKPPLQWKLRLLAGAIAASSVIACQGNA